MRGGLDRLLQDVYCRMAPTVVRHRSAWERHLLGYADYSVGAQLLSSVIAPPEQVNSRTERAITAP